ncbi:S8 family serine peptidase [Halorussus marinus]|uniref:S8 family serine peptidase n=1 Tax=Halorussus marinus TaxID=2505976 RepID=UPI00106E8E83|nr:S8 family serine peptidase [Halorussus marinus]
MSDRPRPRARRLAATLAFVAVLVTSAAVPAFAAPAPTGGAPAAADRAATAVTAPPAGLGPDATASEGIPRPPGVNESADVEIIGANDSEPPTGANRTDVTLVTGQTVTAVETANGTRYRVAGDDRMRKVTTGDATYVYPAGVDFETFGRRLFDVDLLVRQNLTDAETDAIPVIVSGPDRPGPTAEERTPADTLEAVEGVRPRATLDSIGAAAATVGKARARRAARRFAADDAVARVTLDAKHRLDLRDADEAVGATRARRTYGATGDGVTVAVVDSGIDDDHPAIDRVVAERDFTYEGRTDDPNGHGTHVAGIVASDDETYTGMAPDASLIDARVLTEDGWGYTSWILAGMEYAVDSGADVVSVSLGGSVGSERSDDRYTEAVDSATDRGAVVVTSAGNGGDAYGTVTTPGIQSRALTVGASVDDDGIPGFSSRGPTKYGYYLKPDLVAPGWGVVSAAAGTDGFARKTGTSMAAPAVSGVAALLLEDNPDWSPARIRGVLTATADPLSGPDVYTQGAGVLNATEALGSELAVAPATVDFGTLRRGDDAARTVKLTNTGDETTTVDADAAATDVRDGDAAPVSVNRSTVSVDPGETAHLRLAVDAGDASPGTYSGRLSVGNHTVVFGFVREHAITVEKAPVPNTSTAGDRVWLFADRPGRSKLTGRDGLVRLNGSSTTYHAVGGGTYRLLSSGRDERTGEPIVFERTLTVDGDERVVLNETETVRHDLDTGEIGPVATRNVTVDYAATTASGRTYGGSITAPNPDAPAVRFGPDSALNATVGRLLVSNGSGDGAAFDAAAVYHLLHEVDGVDGGRTTTVDPDALAAKNVTYRRASRDGSYEATMRATAGEFTHAVVGGVGDRRTQTVYLTDGVDDHAIGASGDEWRLTPSATGFHGPNATSEVAFNRHPFLGSLRWTVDDGDLRYRAAGQTDGDGHRFADGRADSIRVRVDGRERLSRELGGAPAWRDPGVEIAPGADLELTVVGRNGATPLSTRTVTTHRATYAPGDDDTPPGLRSLAVRELSANNTAGRDLRVRFAVDGDAERAEAWLATDAEAVPFGGDSAPAGDDPTGWTAGSVERVDAPGDAAVYEATFRVAAGHLGRVDLAVAATDDRGNAMESTVFDAVRVDARGPAVAVASLGADGSTATDGSIHTNGTVSANVTADDAAGAVGNVSLGLSAAFANYRTELPAARTPDGDWAVDGDLTDLPDDGTYSVRALARDRFGNENRTAPAGTVALDREPPALGATLTRVDDATGRVTVSADEPLASTPEATVERPNGTSTDVALNATGDREWAGTVSLADGDAGYGVTATATDRAGNPGRAVSNASVAAVDASPGRPATVSPAGSDAFVRLRTDRVANGSVTLTQSGSAFAPLEPGLTGLGFLNADLDSAVSGALANATVGIPVDESRLPPGVAPGDVEVRYRDPATGGWDRRATAVRNVTVDGATDAYWVANVTRFSTYGAVAPDETPPTIDGRAPDGGEYRRDGGVPAVAFEYGDDRSAVNASAVELFVDGERVTDAPATSVTSEAVRYGGAFDYGTHAATIRVVDEAGNAANATTTFAVVGDETPPRVVEASPADGAELPAGTDSRRFEFALADDATGVNPDAVRVRYDGADVTADATVSADAVAYTVDSLADGSDHAIELVLEDEAGNGATYTHAFGVADSEPEQTGGGAGGGGGSGGGSVPPPSVRAEVTERDAASATIKIVSARADAPGRVTLDDGLRGGEVAFRTVGLTPASSEPEPRFFLGLDASAGAPTGVPALADASRTLGYLNATPTYIADGELDAVWVRFGVDTATTDAPAGVSLYRYADGDWRRLDTDLVGTRDGAHRFTASAAGTGAFAVGLDEPVFEVRSAGLNASSVRVGEAVAVTASVENAGMAAGIERVGLAVDGETVVTANVTLAPGETEAVRFDRAFETPGERSIAVGGATAGTLAVTADRAETPEPTTAETDATDDPTRDGGTTTGAPGFGLLATVVALVGAAVAAWRESS